MFGVAADNSVKDYIWRHVLKNDLESLQKLFYKLDNSLESFQWVDPQAGWSYLHAADISCSDDVLDFLITQAKNDVNLADKKNMSPIMVAILRKKLPTAIILHETYGALIPAGQNECWNSFMNWRVRKGAVYVYE